MQKSIKRKNINSTKFLYLKKNNNHYYCSGAFSCFSPVFCISDVHMSMITGPSRHWGNKPVTGEEEGAG